MGDKFIQDTLIIWTTIDPIGTLALFAALSAELTDEERRKTALKATLYSGIILIGSIILGQIMLNLPMSPLSRAHPPHIAGRVRSLSCLWQDAQTIKSALCLRGDFACPA